MFKQTPIEALVKIARFLDTTYDCLRDGYRTDRDDYTFTGDEIVFLSSSSMAPATDVPDGDLSSLPLAYQVEEVDEGAETLESISESIYQCHACPLGKTRSMAVPGEGSPHPKVLVIGEGPGAEEDASGRPFVGPAGQLLDKMLASIGLSREENCFIANVVKCRPPENRDPLPGEITACGAFLERQISILEPMAILCVGRVAATTLLKSSEGIGRLRGRFFGYRGIPLLATYHPSAILRDESLKRPVWEDLKLLRDKLAER
ncbi:MAG: uracil-DNA glycosylase [Treponema sp.]|jgi:DNA polymerase|nr:uracil-DNA glycosylase [Treponema sp.]